MRSAAAPSDPQLELGQRVHANRCASCHGRAGDGGVGPKLGDGAVVSTFPDAADHRAVVVEGRNTMPAWGKTLSAQEIDSVVRFQREALGR